MQVIKIQGVTLMVSEGSTVQFDNDGSVMIQNSVPVKRKVNRIKVKKVQGSSKVLDCTERGTIRSAILAHFKNFGDSRDIIVNSSKTVRTAFNDFGKKCNIQHLENMKDGKEKVRVTLIS